MRQTQTRPADVALTDGERRHLLRRLTFAATPVQAQALRGLSAEAALSALVSEARAAAHPDPPVEARGVWTNSALRVTGMTDDEYEAVLDAQQRVSDHDVEELRRWWLQELMTGPSPLRENLVLFFHGTFGSATSSVGAPHALHGRNALIRRACLGTIPDLLEALVVDPAMMMQIGMDEHGLFRVSDRPAKLILDHWTVGAGAYELSDVEELSRALTGWLLVAPDGEEPPQSIDPRAPRTARRTGLVPRFRAEEFDDGSKTILGTTRAFDARSAVRWLAMHPATARRFSRHLVAYLGVEDPTGQLQTQLVGTYRTSGGSMEALLRDIVRSDAFWSEPSRWALIKSPIHLAVGGCRQLDIEAPPLAEISRWLRAAGQTLFDTPNGGEGGWPSQEAWVSPPGRLAVRYHLAAALSGHLPALGLESSGSIAVNAGTMRVPVGSTLRGASAAALLEQLDPAPGLDAAAIEREVSGVTSSEGRSAFIRRVMMTPQYQLA